MLNVSERAKDILSAAVEVEKIDDGKALRLAKTGEGQYGLVQEPPRDDDQIVMKNQQPLLYVDNDVSRSLDGATLDVVERDGEEKLTLNPPA